MLDEETYRKEIVRMWDTLRDYEKMGEYSCKGVLCNKCPLFGKDNMCGNNINAFEFIKVVEKWSNEHPPKKYKVSKLEYDIMRAAIDYSSEEEAFKDVDILYELLINGYFSGAKSNDKIIDFFKNCEVEEDDR